jgi:DNA-binding CsgD family transcriptional regulator
VHVVSRENTLLEREDELERLDELCRQAVAGDGTVVAIQGPPGIGKTTLIHALRRAAEGRGFAVMQASGAELERELAFGVVRQLFERPLRELSARERGQLLEGAGRLALPVVLDPEPISPRPEAMHAAMHGLYWLAAGLAARAPLLLVIDDAHWADPPSLRWLAYCSRRLDGVPVLIVVASRAAEPGAQSELLEQALTEARATVLRPATLSRAGVDRWLARSYGVAPATEFVDACWGATGGNTLLLEQLTAELRAEGLPADAYAAERLTGVAPASIARSVLMRLARLGPQAVAVAEAVAVLSQDARLDRVAALAGTSVPDAAGLVDRLAFAGILAHGDPLTFAHPVMRAAVYEQIPAARRGLAHVTAAKRLIADAAGVERAASHLMLAPATGDPAIVDALRNAAAAASARGAPDAAATLLRRALAEPPTDPTDVLLELAAAEAVTQDPAAVEHARDAIAAAPTAAQRARGALLAANAMLWFGHDEAAREVLEGVERDSEGLDDQTRGAVQASKLLIATYTSGVHLDERLTALAVDELVGASPSERILLTLRAIDLTIRGRPRQEVLALTRRTLAREPLSRPSHEFVPGALVRVLAVADELEEARSTISAVIDAARTRGAVIDVAYGCFLRSEIHWRAGWLVDAEGDAREALEISLEHAFWSASGAMAWLAATLVERDSPAAALAAIEEGGIDVGGQKPVSAAAALLHARGTALTASGDAVAAVTDFRAAGCLQLSFGEINPTGIPWRSSLALALHSLGERHEGQALVDEELELARQFGAPRAIGIALRARALLASGDAVVGGLEEAVRTLADSPARLEHARALVDLGAALRRAGRRVEARKQLSAGLDAADRCGARQLAGRALAELHAAGARPRRERLSGPDALTASERRVAQLAADGLTNRQIAQALFVTSKTVEMHLGRVYSKLGITGRSKLAAALEEGRMPGRPVSAA